MYKNKDWKSYISWVCSSCGATSSVLIDGVEMTEPTCSCLVQEQEYEDCMVIHAEDSFFDNIEKVETNSMLKRVGTIGKDKFIEMSIMGYWKEHSN